MAYQGIDYNAGTIGTSMYDNGVKVANDVSFTIPKVSYTTAEAQVAGPQNVPIVGQFDDMQLTVNFNNVTEETMNCFTAGTHTFDLRWKDYNFEEATINSKYRLHKVVCICMPNEAGPEMEITQGERNDYELTAAVISLTHYVDGKEIVHLNRAAKQFRQNGVDKFKDIREGL